MSRISDGGERELCSDRGTATVMAKTPKPDKLATTMGERGGELKIIR